MKKKINVLLATSLLAVAALAACGFNGGETPSVSQGDEPTSSVDSQPETVDLAALAQKVLAGIEPTYSAWSSKGVSGDQELITSSRRTADDGEVYEFTIRYSVEAAYSANLAISESGDKLIVTTPNSLDGGTNVQAKIHAEVLLRGESTVLASSDINVLVNAVAKMNLAYIYSTKADGSLTVPSGEAVSFNAMYIGEYPQQGSIYADGDYAIITFKAYAPEGTTVGTIFNISGKLSDYSGLRELASDGLAVTKLDSNPGVAVPSRIVVDDTNTPDLAFKDSNRPIRMKGVVQSTTLKDNANSYIYVTCGSKTYTVYMHATYAADKFASWKHTRSGATEAEYVKAGDEVELTGFVSAYNNNMQVVYAECTSWSEPAATVDGASSVIMGASTKLTGSVKGGAEATWTWTSSDDTIATVDAEGNVTGIKVGSVTITGKVTVDGKEVVVKHTIEVIELKLVQKSVDEMLAMAKADTKGGVYDRANLYEVTGILDGRDSTDAYGNARLVNPETGKSIMVYGLTGSQDLGISYSSQKGGWDFSNPKDAKESLADVQNGEEVTIKALFEDYNGTAEIMGVVTSHKASTNEYDVSVNTPENGTASVSKTKAAYGDEIEVTATPAEGYVVDKIVVTAIVKQNESSKAITANAEGKYIFNATTTNKVTVSFKEAPAPVDPGDTGGSTTDTALLTITKESIGNLTGGSGYAAYNGDHTVGSYTVKSTAVMQGAQGGLDTLQFQKTNGTLSIDNIKVSKVKMTLVSKYDFTSNAQITANFGGSSYALDDAKIATCVENRTAAPTADFYCYTYELAINASAAGTLELKAGSAGANYASEIVIY